MFCPKCGKSLPESAAFCNGCGTQIHKKTAPTPENPITVQAQAPSLITKTIEADAKKTAPATPQQSAPKPAFQSMPLTQQSTKPVTKSLKAQKPPKQKKPKKQILTKDNIINVVIWLLLVLVYAAISFICVSVLEAANTITLKSAHNNFEYNLYFNEFLSILLNGNRAFNPTAISTTIALCVTIFCYATPVACGISALGALLTKKVIRFNIMASLVSIITSLLIMFCVSFSLRFAPVISDALSNHAGMLSDDIKTITYSPLIIVGVIILALVVVTMVISIILYSRRRKK